MVLLYPHQKQAVEELKSGSILCGGVGTGKSMTALDYYYEVECKGEISDQGDILGCDSPKDLYIITTARKRDTKEWEGECARFNIPGIYGADLKIDSWNNIHKYESVRGAFFIFDEQRVVGSGSWVKSFLKIAKSNHWILLSATPGDTWVDYIPVFIANGFYKNRSEFLRRHAVYNRYSKYPKIDKFLETGYLEMLRRKITVKMDFSKHTVPHFEDIWTSYDKDLYRTVSVDRWNPYDNEPIQNISEACYLMRKVTNSDNSRYSELKKLAIRHPKIIVFYNFDYELEQLRKLKDIRTIAEYNGHKHEPIPDTVSWIYLVQYTAGAEGWNCTDTNVIVFYSQNYSYKVTTQAAGRIDRLNTPYRDLYYYVFKSRSPIDLAIAKALKGKKNFNETSFLEEY